MIGICIDNVSKCFGDKIVYSSYSQAFEAGKYHVIMGPSGCGKTTLLNMIMGIEKPDSGRIIFMDGDGNEVQPEKVRISAVFQEDRLCEARSAIDNVMLVSRGKKKKQVFCRAEYILESMGLKDSMDMPVARLSGGMRRRVAIARALMAEYDIILADEPFGGLDDELKSKVARYFMQETEGKTAIVITHDEREHHTDNFLRHTSSSTHLSQ